MSPKFRGVAVAVALTVLAALAVVANARVTVANVRRMTATQDWVVHTHQVVEALQQLQGSLVDAETGERGYLITGDARYLEPYATGRAAVDGTLDRLDDLTQDSQGQQALVRELRRLVAAKLDQLERTVSLRKRPDGGFEAVREVVLSGEGKQLMDAVRAAVGTMMARERVLLDERTRASASAARAAVVTSLVGMAASLVFLVFAVAVARDRLRERSLAATRAQEEKERFRITLASVGDAVVVTDAVGTVTMLNPTARALLGYGDEAIGRPLDDVFHIVNEETKHLVENPVRKVLREGRTQGLANHTVLVLLDGRELPIDDSAAPIRREDGAVVGVVLVFRDIGERRELERAQQRTAELLQDRDRRKDEFLAVLAHELRNPLSPARNALALLRRARPESEPWERAMGVLDRQVAHMARLVDDLLDVSRIAQGKIRLQREPVDLADVVRRAVDDFRSVFAKKRIALELRAPDEPLWVDADATRLAQVAGNLLQNAAKFTDPRGRVTVALGREDGRARLEVRDSGEGIDRAALPTIFLPFVQAEGTVHRSTGGLGLGLALSRSIVELHGGTVGASSEGRGKGATFVVTLPLLNRLAVAVPQSPVPAPPERLRILVIDDEEDSGTTLRDLLELEGHEVSVALDARAGVEAALSERPDVVLCDVGMEGEDGYAVARRLRAAGSAATLVAFTGYASAEDVQRAREAGFDHHLAKPAGLAELRRLFAVAPRVHGSAAAQEHTAE